MNLSTCLAVLAPFTLLACVHVNPGSSGTHTTQPRAAGAFTRIEVRGPVDVVVHEGRPLALSLTTQGVEPARVETRVEGDTLVVDLHGELGGCIGICEESARLDIDAPVLNGVKIEGSGDVTVLGAGSHAKVDLDVDGSGDVHYAGAAEVLACRVTGSGDVTLSGSAKRLHAEVTGSGDVDARSFAAEGGEFLIEGSGDVTANLHGGDTTIRMHGSGDLRYTGEARITSLDISGSGDVAHM